MKIAENCQINNSNIFISGKNNEVIIEKNSVINFLNLSIVGDNNRVFIDENFCAATSFCLTIGNLPNIFAKNTSVEIGSNTCIRSLFCVLYENSSFLKIGKDCMFSDNIEIWGTDTHSVLDLDGNILNKAKGVEIGNHVWIGKDVKIGKAAKISDDSIVSFGSVVYSKFNDKNIVIAGNPANIKRRNITWCRETPENYKRLREERKIKCQKLNCQIMLQED